VLLLDHPSWKRPSSYGLRFGAAGDHFLRCGSVDGLSEAVDLALRKGSDPQEVERRDRGLDLVYSPRAGGDLVAAEAIIDV
jgi:hypothetical protein